VLGFIKSRKSGPTLLTVIRIMEAEHEVGVKEGVTRYERMA
jgi:hypothetical protein